MEGGGGVYIAKSKYVTKLANCRLTFERVWFAYPLTFSKEQYEDGYRKQKKKKESRIKKRRRRVEDLMEFFNRMVRRDDLMMTGPSRKKLRCRPRSS